MFNPKGYWLFLTFCGVQQTPPCFSKSSGLQISPLVTHFGEMKRRRLAIFDSTTNSLQKQRRLRLHLLVWVDGEKRQESKVFLPLFLILFVGLQCLMPTREHASPKKEPFFEFYRVQERSGLLFSFEKFCLKTSEWLSVRWGPLPTCRKEKGALKVSSSSTKTMGSFLTQQLWSVVIALFVVWQLENCCCCLLR